MSNEFAEAFLDQLAGDSDLRREVQSADAGPQRVTSWEWFVDLGAAHGYAFTAEELRDACAARNRSSRELRDAELDVVSAGVAGDFVASLDTEAAVAIPAFMKNARKAKT